MPTSNETVPFAFLYCSQMFSIYLCVPHALLALDKPLSLTFKQVAILEVSMAVNLLLSKLLLKLTIVQFS